MFDSSEPTQSKTRLITRRMFMLTTVKLAVFLGIVARLFYLQISENIKYRSLSDKNRLREWKVPPQRGIIEDFFGEKIADNKRAYRYLEQSISQFPHQDVLLANLKKIGYINPSYTNLFDGIVCIHKATKI